MGMIRKEDAVDLICMDWCGCKFSECEHKFDPTVDEYYWCDGCDDAIRMNDMPTVPLDKEYAKAVRNWMVNYQVRCAELQGCYTPYEVLGWVVSDWRKDNEIW